MPDRQKFVVWWHAKEGGTARALTRTLAGLYSASSPLPEPLVTRNDQEACTLRMPAGGRKCARPEGGYARLAATGR